MSAAAGFAGAEAVTLIGYTGVYVAQVLPFEDDATTRALIAGGVALFLLMAAAAIGGAALALVKLQRWSRSLLLVVQLIAAAVTLPLALDGRWAAWLVVGVAAAIVALILAPTTTAALEH